MNKTRLVLLGLGIVLCGSALAYLGLQEQPSRMVPAEPSVAKAAPKLSATPASAWKADAQDVSTSVAPSKFQQQQEQTVSELAKRFQDALASGDPKQTLDAMTAWANVDPAAAAMYAASMNPGPQRDRLLREAAQRWTARDSGAALAWATQGGTAAEQEQLVEAICEQVGQTDPQEAISLAERFGLPGDYASVKGSLAEQWAAKDPTAAVNWALSQSQGEERNQFVAEVASVQARTSPIAATQLVLQQIPPGPEQDNAVLAVLDGWARQDLAAATAWVNQFPPNLPLRTRAQAVLGASHTKQVP